MEPAFSFHLKSKTFPNPYFSSSFTFFITSKRIRDVEHVSLAARPSAVCVEIDRTPLSDEAPAHHMRLLSVAAGRESLRMPRGCASLADLVHVSHELETGLTVATEIHDRLAAAERGL
jgi:hypothetical protein